MLPSPYADHPSLPPHQLRVLFRTFLSQWLSLPVAACLYIST
jgi:hypothetical protein